MPSGTIYVGRPTMWGNRWRVGVWPGGARSVPVNSPDEIADLAELHEGRPRQNDMRFCCYCGGPLDDGVVTDG